MTHSESGLFNIEGNDDVDLSEFFRRRARDLGIGPVSESGIRNPVRSVHDDRQRFGIPPGRTVFDFSKGEARHVDSGTVLEDNLPEPSQATNVSPGKETQDDADTWRSLTVFADSGVILKTPDPIPLDPCIYYTARLEQDRITVEAELPTDLYMLPGGRATTPVEPMPLVGHIDRVGPSFTGTPDAFTGLGFQTIDSAEDGGLADADAQKVPLHAQNYGHRTFVVENTSADDAADRKIEARIVGNATHRGYGRFTSVDPANQPVTIGVGQTEIFTVNEEAWHLLKLQIRNTTNGNQVSAGYEFNGVTT